MQTRLLGPQQTPVSAIGLGCMGMSEFYGASDDSESLRTMARAVELGVTFFDGADTYGLGHNESLIGRFLAEGGGARRRQVVIATKFGIVREAGNYERRIDNSPAYIRSACDASLRRLGVEQIDLYYCHRRNPVVPIEEMVGAMSDLVKAGKVSQLGLSEVSADSLRRAAAIHPIAAVQSEYSLWTRDAEREMLATCRELGSSFVAYSPLGRAFLTGTVNPEKLAENDFRKASPRFQGVAERCNRLLVDQLTRIASVRGLSRAQLALAWLLSKHPHVIPIPGTRRISYLEQNALAANRLLSAAEVAELDQLFDPAEVSGERYPPAGMLGLES